MTWIDRCTQNIYVYIYKIYTCIWVNYKEKVREKLKREVAYNVSICRHSILTSRTDTVDDGIYACTYTCQRRESAIYIYIYRERERERERGI